MDSLELHLDYFADEIITDRVLTNSTGGLYPAYYVRENGRLKISISVITLLRMLGSIDYNPNFKPNSDDQFLHTYETVDRRISRLRPFEITNGLISQIDFRPTWESKDIITLLRKSVQYFTDFVQNIERRYPDKKQVLLTGGRDSRITLLVPKLNPKAWYVFSSQPDLYYIRRWLSINDIKIAGIFEHAGFVDPGEDFEFFKRMVIASDAYFDLRHMRWTLKQKQISEYFQGQCIFWTGDTGLIYLPNPFCKLGQKRDFFDETLIRAALYHGSKNQLIKNITGCPRLSMYYSSSIWYDLYRNFDFSMVDKDYRELLGDYVAGRKIWWENSYPPVECWEFPFSYDLEKIYLDYIKESI